MKKFLAVAALLTFSASAIADDLTIPNTFQAGTPARADDVNANFTAVEASVDDNAADIAANEQAISGLAANSGIRIYSQGTSIGRLLGFPSTFNDGSIWMITDEGYMAYTSLDDEAVWLNETTYYFSDFGCTGDVYLSPAPRWVNTVGGVYISDQPTLFGPYYVPSGSSWEIVTVNSFTNRNGCRDNSITATFLLALPNDEAITGVPDLQPARPFSVGSP